MTDHFIKNIEIKDFKCFDNFKAEGFARVNLIGGKNNVGKTVFLEAIYINIFSNDVATLSLALYGVKAARESLNSFLYDEKNSNTLQKLEKNFHMYIEQSNNIFVISNKNSIHYHVEEENGVKNYHFDIGRNEPVVVNVKDFSIISISETTNYSSSNVELIHGADFNNNVVKKQYSSVQKKDKEGFIDRLLNEFDSDIEAFKIINEIPQCKNNGVYRSVTEFGDGTGHLITILTALFNCENGYLFIDEIDNGIHYTALDNIWHVILTLSKELNVQVFSTTHSKECIESYARVAKKLEEQDITYTILSKLKDGSIDAGVYDSEMLANTLEQDHEVRGW